MHRGAKQRRGAMDGEDLLTMSSPPWLLIAARFVEQTWRFGVASMLLLLFTAFAAGQTATLVLAVFGVAYGAGHVIAAAREAHAHVYDILRRRDLLIHRLIAHPPQS